MPSVPMIPAHEREHIERATEYLASFPEQLRTRWERAFEHFEEARVYDAFLEFNELLKSPDLDTTAKTHVQLQAVRCLR
ncbi:MAG: hypothetical protein IH855_10680, partial [Bacteroidetes bacterium]|nr:hypothetical protein [Bacteroidota bacterium]